MVKRTFVVAVLVASSAGCGHERPFVEPLRARSLPMRFEAAPVPPSAAPGLGPARLAFLSRRIGFVATTGGGFYEQSAGYVRPTEPGLIERTTDGGARWTAVYRAPRVAFERIAFADSRHGVAIGNLLGGRRDIGPNPPLRPFVVVTGDGGRHWRRLDAPTSVAASSLLLPAADAWYAAGRRLLVSTDQGRSWSARSLPHGATLTTFPSVRVGYAQAPSPCGERIWKTTDGGSSWAALAGTCARSYSSLDFLGARVGWAVTGIPRYDPGSGIRPGPLLIRRTDDGGRTWATVYRSTRWLPDTQVRFIDREHGWAVSQESASGAHAHFDALHRTSDGGRTWATVRYPALPTAFAGRNDAWAGEVGGGLLWRTTDGGRSWRLTVRPDLVRPQALLTADRSTVAIESSAGSLASSDGGRTWSSIPPPSGAAVARALRQPVYLRPTASGPDGVIPELSRDGGRTWRPLARPAVTRYDTGDVAFSDPDHGLIAAGQGEFGPDGRARVFATDNGGRSWRRLRMPPGVQPDDEVTLGPGVVVVRRPPVLYLSTDEGRHWQTIRVRDDFWDCGISRPQPNAIWILCSLSVTQGPTLLLRSSDGGSSWRRLSGPVWLEARLVALDGREAWAIAQPAALDQGAAALWHTTDGGSTWHEVWPSIPEGTLARDRRSFGPHPPPA